MNSYFEWMGWEILDYHTKVIDCCRCCHVMYHSILIYQHGIRQRGCRIDKRQFGAKYSDNDVCVYLPSCHCATVPYKILCYCRLDTAASAATAAAAAGFQHWPNNIEMLMFIHFSSVALWRFFSYSSSCFRYIKLSTISLSRWFIIEHNNIYTYVCDIEVIFAHQIIKGIKQNAHAEHV